MNPDDNPTPEDPALQADLDRLRAQVGPAALEEAARRDIGGQMMFDALERVMAADDLARLKRSVDLWTGPEEEGWEE